MVAKRAHHPMHIKRRTRGSSNEISFSVLDAAREARDADERDRREGGSGGPSLFTLGKGKKPVSYTHLNSLLLLKKMVCFSLFL